MKSRRMESGRAAEALMRYPEVAISAQANAPAAIPRPRAQESCSL